ncbi:MAG: hypothetical protein KF878_35860 [Planctomycetes bacterium]|nr:hypothetical protein [Planctomycetota bacterium]
MIRTALLLTLAVALATPALAEDFGVSAPEVAGRASVDEGRFSLALTTFSRSGQAQRVVKGEVVRRTPTALTLRYEVEAAGERGFIDALLLRPAPVVRVTETATLRARAGGWEGTVAGVAQRWVRQGALEGDTVVLVVPGLSTNLWNQYGVPYLDENLAALRARGLEARRLAVNTEESIAVNAAVIAREVRTEVARGKRVVLLAHSKGGADTITALADPTNRDLLPHVRGLMAIQPVYGGSPIADLVGGSCAIQGTVDLFFERALPRINRVDDVGSRDAVRDLRSETRQALLRRHPYPAAEVPTVVLRSSFSGRSTFKPRHVLRKPLFVFQKFLEKTQGVASDGMVSLEWQRVPGAAAEITLQDMDHFEPGFRGESPHSPCKVTNLIVDRMAAVLAD